jgi:hypothetical protein
VACRITDAEKDWFVLLARLREGSFAPRKPIDRIVLVLEEVRRLLACESIRVSGSGFGGRWHFDFVFCFPMRADRTTTGAFNVSFLEKQHYP